MTSETTFRLFACVIPVAGAGRALLCDVQRGTYHQIPLGMHALLVEANGQSMSELKASYPPEDHARIDEALAMVVEAELGFFDDGTGDFPALDLTYRHASRITNAVVDVGDGSEHDYATLFGELDELGCNHVELRFFRPVTADEMDRILAPTLRGRLRSIELLVPHAGWDVEAFDTLCDKHVRIATVSVHGAPTDEMSVRNRKWNLRLFREHIGGADACGKIHPAYFSTNLQSFTEAQRFNSCLNRKVGVDVDGNIKNCPSHGTCHGKLGADSLVQITSKDEFRAPWSMARDEVEVCRDCEYRYVCTDCRVFIADPDNPLSKPAKCNYDPYSGQWGAAEEAAV